MTAPEFILLRAIHWSFSAGDLLPEPERTPADEARTAAFFVVQEILRLLNKFRRCCLRGERCHLVVNKIKRERDHVVIDIQLVFERDRSPK